MKILQEFKDLIPALTAEEYKQLEENCLAEGIRDAIITWEGFIIDGHNRFEIAIKHNLKFTTVNKEFESKNDVREWMINNQFGRRNLSNYQRSVLALQLEEVFKEKAKESKIEKVSHFRKTGEVLANLPKPDTRKELSNVAGVGERTISMVKVIEAKASEEVKAKLRTGELTINQAYQEIKKEDKREEQEIKKQEYIKKALDFKNNDIQIFNKDFRKLDLQENSIDLILTDPPYPYEFLELWKDLFLVAKKVLKPNAFLIAYSGQMYLDKIFQYANEAQLDYYWMINIEFTKKPLIHGRKVLNEWKPILVFQNGIKQNDKIFNDKIKMDYSVEREMHDLNWGQTVAPFEFLLDKFSNEMDLIFEPFAGTGTTLVACKNMKRKCIATEIEEKYIDLIKSRL